MAAMKLELAEVESSEEAGSAETLGLRTHKMKSFGAGALILNADDWGRDRQTTDRILECRVCSALSSASGMVFMEDSERAADLAREHGFDVGLHLNLTTKLSGANVSMELKTKQERLTSFLRRSRMAQMIYHPGLAGDFRYVVSAQIDEFQRLYGAAPRRVDGHHHMHLCANVLYGDLLPHGAIARRNFSFQAGEKSGLNRMYRRMVDRKLAKQHPVTDYFFTIEPVEDVDRLKRIIDLAQQSLVEVETHPVNPKEHALLTGGGIFRRLGDVPIASRYELSGNAAWTQ